MGQVTPRLVVIGGSAGAIGPLRRIVGGLSASFPAPVLVCLHMAEDSTSRLPEIVTGAGPLPARHPRFGDELRAGTVFVAPPGRHLVVHRDAVHLSSGPKENRHRPAIDALFNSAARWHGENVVGVVLSGALDDGAAGAAAIAAQDGTVIVQDPEEARVGSMPMAAIRAVRRARVVPAADVPSLLDQLTRPPAAEAHASPDAMVEWETENVDATSAGERPAIPGTPAALGCPDCHGGMFETTSPAGIPHYVCHVGHSWSPESLVLAQRQGSEAALYAAAAKLVEEAIVVRRIADLRRDGDDAAAAAGLEAQARQAETQAEQIQAMLRHA